MKKIDVVFVVEPSQYEICLGIRQKVFVEEQGVPESIEIDEYEKESKHFLVLVDGVPGATGRLRLKKSYAKFERIATLDSHRGLGLGRVLMKAMQEYAAENFSEYLPAMHAQMSAVGFYEKIGWVAIGGEFVEADIPHKVLIYPPHEKHLIEKLQVWNDAEAREDIHVYLKGLL